MIERLVRDGSVVARTDGTVHTLSPVAVNADEALVLRDWVTREGAVNTIEIGLGYGLSALHICEGLRMTGDPTVRHTVIDPHQATRFASCGLQVLDEAGLLDLVEHHVDVSQIVLPRFVSKGRSFDLAFVDGNHRFDGVFVDLYYLGRLLRPGAVVFVDDYQLLGVARAVAFFVTNLGWAVEAASAADDLHHWVVLRTSPDPDARPFDFYVDF